jgi:hypothetical protein
MSKNLAAKARCIFGATERFGCTMIAGFANERKVRCHTVAVEMFRGGFSLTLARQPSL